MTLEELVPQESTLTLNVGEQKVDLKFRLFNITDEAWLKQNYKQQRLLDVFQNMDMIELSRIGYRLLDPESKRTLLGIKFISDLDESGKEIVVEMTPLEKFQYLLTGYETQLQLLNCLLLTRGLSLPRVEELNQAAEELAKKKDEMMEKGNQTGENSSILSQANTDTPSSNSAQ